MKRNIVKHFVEKGAKIAPLLVPFQFTKMTGLCNPSVFVDGDAIFVNIRNVEYTLYHSEEEQKFPSYWGPLAYLHKENDPYLRTVNFICKLNPDSLEVEKHYQVNTSLLDQKPLWEFIGLEDGRLVRWNEKLYLTGVRRDTTTNGQGRMELSEIVFEEGTVKEVSRVRIETPIDKNSYCEKNWMPILDKPFHYVKWTNPTEIVEADPETGESKQVFVSKKYLPISRDLRGGSQVVRIGDYYFCITHEVDLFKNINGNKDGNYYHRIVCWDMEWNFIHISEPFNFLDADIEFACGLALYKENVLITFGFQDNAAFILSIPEKVFLNEINENAKQQTARIHK